MAEGKDPVAGTPTIKKTNQLLYAAVIGIYAGIIWGGLHVLAYYLKFSEVIPAYVLEPFFKHRFLTSIWGLWLGLITYVILSIVAAVMYALLFSKWKGPWPGILYGALWYGLMYFAIGPAFQMMDPIGKLSWNTIWTDACLFILWGVFIGYSITYEFTDERHHPKGEGMVKLQQP